MKNEDDDIELKYLKFYYVTADFGPAHEDVVYIINQRFEKETGLKVPVKYQAE